VHHNRAGQVDPTHNHRDPGVVRESLPPAGRAPRTRTGNALLALSAGTATLVALIVFMLQKTRSAEVTFPWVHANAPLARSLVIAGVGIAILAMSVDASRIGQLPGLARRRR
jgi:uncharacterized integral membrane protein